MNLSSFKIANGILLKFTKTDEKDIIIPDGVKVIAKRAFLGSNIHSIIIPPSVTDIEDRAFDECNQLRYVTLNEGLETIGNAAFFGTSLSEIRFPDSLKSIGDFAFARGPFNSPSQGYLPHIITIPKNVEHIGTGAFSDCAYLYAISVDNENEYFSDYNRGLYDKNKTTLLWKSPEENRLKICELPDSVVKIDDCAFSHYCNFMVIKDKTSFCGDTLRNAYKNNKVIVFVGENYCDN